MKKIVVGILLCVLGFSAAALEVAGVHVAEKAQAGEQSLVLNGAGSRLMAGMFHVYVIALYLPEKQHAIVEVLNEKVSKRVALDFLFGVTSVQLLDATHKLMTENLSAEEMNKSAVGWQEFSMLFNKIKEFTNGDQLVLDYQPASGTRVLMNGKELGRVAGAEFMRAFLMVWLGSRPAQFDLKDKLLGLDNVKR
jgi:hypothetical protein